MPKIQMVNHGVCTEEKRDQREKKLQNIKLRKSQRIKAVRPDKMNRK